MIRQKKSRIFYFVFGCINSMFLIACFYNKDYPEMLISILGLIICLYGICFEKEIK